MNAYCRTLSTDTEAEPFVEGILKIKKIDEKRKAINSITAAERNIRDYPGYPTLTHKDNRDFEYRMDDIREKLRAQILNELEHLERLDSDDDISLGVGGAMPKTKPLKGKKLYYVIGPPASGKSTIANMIADATGSYILDSDFAKRKLPEYSNQIGGATLVHEESDVLIFSYECGGKPQNMLDFCIKNGYNMVIPKIGANIQNIVDFCKKLKDIGFIPYLVSVDLDREKAVQRAYNRYVATNRYVPLSLIFDGYGNQPTLNYFKIKQKYNDLFRGFAQISTDVEFGSCPLLLEQKNLKTLENIFGGE